jgi:hypothetical protein
LADRGRWCDTVHLEGMQSCVTPELCLRLVAGTDKCWEAAVRDACMKCDPQYCPGLSPTASYDSTLNDAFGDGLRALNVVPAVPQPCTAETIAAAAFAKLVAFIRLPKAIPIGRSLGLRLTGTGT